MRLLGGDILARMPRPHRQAPEAEAAQERADRSLGQDHAVTLLDHRGEIDATPAHHAVFGQDRSLPNQIGHLRFLRRGQPGRGPRDRTVAEPFQALGVVTMHLVAQRLSVHPATRRGLRAAHPVTDMR